MLYTAAARQLFLSRSVHMCALSSLALWLAHGADAVPPVSLHYNTSNTGLGGQDTRWVKLLGRTPSLEACSQLCLAHAGSAGARCKSFSRYTANKNSSEVGNCYGHVDPAWLPLSAGGVDSQDAKHKGGP